MRFKKYANTDNFWKKSKITGSLIFLTQRKRLLYLSKIDNKITCCCLCSYVAPEYASTGMLNERSDVYSFGVLMMEIISGRKPVDCNRPSEEVCA